MLGGRDGRALQLQAAIPIPLIKCISWILGGRDGRALQLQAAIPIPLIKYLLWMLDGRDGRVRDSCATLIK